MKKRNIISLLVILALSLALTACGTKETKNTSSNTIVENEDNKTAIKPENEPETKVVRWGQIPNRDTLYELAQKNGYFEEYGITVEPVNIANFSDAFPSLFSSKVDILSGAGTTGPLQQIGAGKDLTIFGGHMVIGAEAVFTRDDLEWNSLDDFIGKKFAGLPTKYWLTGPLLELGYDPVNDMEWVQLPNLMDNFAAVLSGEIDFAAITTSQHYQVENMEGVKVVGYSDDFTPRHSCCRIETRTDFIKENPNTIKAIHKALIRAKRDFEMDKENAVNVMADAIGAPYDHVASFLLNEHFDVSPDPLKNAVVNGWNVLKETGFLSEEAKNINIEDHVNTELYLQALEELIEERGDEDPEFYESQMKYFKENNL